MAEGVVVKEEVVTAVAEAEAAGAGAGAIQEVAHQTGAEVAEAEVAVVAILRKVLPRSHPLLFPQATRPREC